jgi:hypothetical protein
MMRTAEVVLIGALVPWVRSRDVAGSSEKGCQENTLSSGSPAVFFYTDLHLHRIDKDASARIDRLLEMCGRIRTAKTLRDITAT